MKLNPPKKLDAALIGYGYWGPNLLRNLIAQGGFNVVGIIEPSDTAAQRASVMYGHIPRYRNLESLLEKVRPDAVVIATPPSTHRELALRCLQQKIHVLVEKPLGMSTSECDEIIAAAKQADRVVMVDHTFVYHPAVQYLASEINSGAFGDLLYYDSVRVNLGGYQPLTNVLWDLAPHDLSILDLFLKGKAPHSISVLGATHYDPANTNICYCHLTYDNGFVAHLNLNWVAPVKIRTVMVGATKKMAIYDDNLSVEKVKIYDKGMSVSAGGGHQFRASYRSGDMVAPAIDAKEALASMLEAFHSYITQGNKPHSDSHAGRRIVRILEAASLSLVRNGEPVELDKAANSRKRPRLSKAA